MRGNTKKKNSGCIEMERKDKAELTKEVVLSKQKRKDMSGMIEEEIKMR